MAPPRVVTHAVKTVQSVLPKRNPARMKKPSPLPQRPLVPDRFRAPRGEKQIFLPNFTLTLLRPPPHQPAHMASFLTPLSLNKLDLKDYLFNLYSIRALHIRSFIIHGKVARDPRTNRLFRRPQKKKMTIEMQSGDGFVWPEQPADLEPWDKKVQDAAGRERRVMMEGRSAQGQDLKVVGRGEREGLRERARALLEGRVRWRAGGGVAPVGMGEARPTATT